MGQLKKISKSSSSVFLRRNKIIYLYSSLFFNHVSIDNENDVLDAILCEI